MHFNITLSKIHYSKSKMVREIGYLNLEIHITLIFFLSLFSDFIKKTQQSVYVHVHPIEANFEDITLSLNGLESVLFILK